MEFLKVVIDKISQYNFLTNIIPGTVLCILLKYFVGYDIIPREYYQAAIVFYFVGIVNARVSSLIVEPILKKIHWVKFAPYEHYIEAEKKDSKVKTLNEVNNTYRSYIAVMFVTMLAYIYKNFLTVYSFIHKHETLFLIIILFILFMCSYRKQTNYVRKRVEHNAKQ